ncbi:olfactory receptor 2C1-like [Manis javanica]|uniref:olfactory receptor 2C1-like n=1 Tax=Manis javanica TaxID=9974 RepID=UPI0008137B87|nr:olfactory receptor 15-like [Manis javanica]
MANNSFPGGFILLGCSEWPQVEMVLFWAVILLYTMVVLSNSAIILLSCVDPLLSTPMYFFLSNLSFLDLCFSTNAVPQMLSNLWGPDKTITYTGCVLQVCVLLCLGATEGVMLVVMAFDRYVAICRPLHYTVIMNRPLCWKLVLTAWLCGLLESVTQTPITFQLPFCAHHRLDDFLCQVPALIRLACTDTSASGLQMTISALLFTVVPVGLILTSYSFIAQALGKIQSEEGRQKAITTCSSHLTVVFILYGTVAMVYTDPENQLASKHGKFFTFFFTVVTPLLNPLIYTLRNKEVKGALQRLLRKGGSMRGKRNVIF